MAQVKTHAVTIKQTLNSKFFNLGVDDVRKGRPFKYDLPDQDEWHYVRGRHFARVFNGEIKNGRCLRTEALYKFADAWYSGAII
jgi:hypothetical protein